jgi:hypothetical protein
MVCELCSHPCPQALTCGYETFDCQRNQQKESNLSRLSWRRSTSTSHKQPNAHTARKMPNTLRQERQGEFSGSTTESERTHDDGQGSVPCTLHGLGLACVHVACSNVVHGGKTLRAKPGVGILIWIPVLCDPLVAAFAAAPSSAHA